MKKMYFAILFALLSFASFAKKTDSRYFELRIYYCQEGRLDALVQRFTNHTTKLFEKHGMENIGYWLPTDNKENALYYVLAFPSKEARDASWKAFVEDPEWKEVAANSEKDGKIISKITSIFMNAAEISPIIKASIKSPERSFELRIVNCLPNRSQNFYDRFKNHTLKLLKKYHIEHIAYWTSIEANNAQPRYVYIVAHKSEEEGKKAWEAFRKDPKWIAALNESEKDGKITEKVTSIYLKPLSFSKIK